MDIQLHRESGVPIRDQLVTQFEVRILDGTLAPGQRLPSVRALARRLKVHANTISAAYQDLKSAGHVSLKKGSGVYVRDAGSWAPQDARGLDEMIRLTLHLALRKGFSAAEIRAAVERWMQAAPPDRVVVVDPVPEMAAILVHELKSRLRTPVLSCSLDDVAKDPDRLRGGLTLVLPYHVEALRALAPAVALRILYLELSAEDSKAVRALPAGSIVLVVTSSPTLPPFAEVLFKGLRGDEILLETRLVGQTREWRRLMKAADAMVADVVAAAALRKAGARRVREVRLVPEAMIVKLQDALLLVTPR
jgi:GntR family transcriptional regulator